MNIKKLVLSTMLLTVSVYADGLSGKEVFNNNCSKCHANILGISNDGGYENTYITPAPYIKDLVTKLKNETKTKKEFTSFIKEYIQNPNKRKSLYGKKAIKKFGLMPSLKGALTTQEINKVTQYLYNYNNHTNTIVKKEHIKPKHVSNGEKLFDQYCSQCHASILGIDNDGGYENSYITVAPYVTKVVDKLKHETKTKKEFSKFIQEYIQNPNKRKSLYGKKAIKKFGLMPSLHGVMNKKEISELTNYLYNIK